MTRKIIVEEPNHGQELIAAYLRSAVKQGKQFFKSKYIASELGMSAKEVGANMRIISDDERNKLKIERYTYARSTTWHVEATG